LAIRHFVSCMKGTHLRTKSLESYLRAFSSGTILHVNEGVQPNFRKGCSEANLPIRVDNMMSA